MKKVALLLGSAILIASGSWYHLTTLADAQLRYSQLEKSNSRLKETCKSVRTEYEIQAISNNAWKSVEGLKTNPVLIFPC